VLPGTPPTVPAVGPVGVPAAPPPPWAAYSDDAAEQAAEAEVQQLCLLGEVERAWAQFRHMRSLWRAAQGRRSMRPGCSFNAFNAPYQRAFASIRSAVGPAWPAPLPERRWVDIPDLGGAGAPGGIPLRVFTLNVLSEHLNNQFSFQFVALPPRGGDFLPWALRAPLLVQEVVRWRPQLVALQEVDDVLYGGLVQELARSAGLTALPFARRKLNPRGDGVCVLYDASALRLVPGSHAVRYLTHSFGGVPHPGGVLAVAVFDLLVEGKAATGRRLVVGTAHVNPSPAGKEALEAGIEPANGEEYGTDAGVAAQLLAGLDDASRSHGGADVRLLLGDLNGVTESGSAAFSQARMDSAYAAAGEAAAEDWRGSLVTAHNDIFHWGGELDVVLSRGAQVHRVLQIPRHPRLLPAPRSREHAATSLPMAGWPSDHMSLAADLSIDVRQGS